MGLLNEINNINASLNKKEREQAEKQRQKEFQSNLFKNCDSFLFEKMMQKINLTKNSYVIYLDIIKFELIENVIIEINKRYDLLQETKDKINFYLDNNYYKVANKVINIYNKQQKAINFIPDTTETTDNQKMSMEEKAIIIGTLINIFLFISPIAVIIYLISVLFSF